MTSSSKPIVDELVWRWAEAREAESAPSVDELCREHPELRSEVRRRIDMLQAMDWLTDVDAAVHMPPHDLYLQVTNEVAPFQIDPPTVDQLERELTSLGLVAAQDIVAVMLDPACDKDAMTPAMLLEDLRRRNILTDWQVWFIKARRTSDLVIGGYVLTRKLGEGGMGQVFLARHPRMKRKVALKLLAAHLTASPGVVERFRREIEATARLAHPNIVMAHDAGECRGRHYLVMEFIDGNDLLHIVKSSGPLSVSHAVQVVQQAAEGLAYAHEHGIVHRDIKPSNLLLDRSGAVKVLDLGLARIISREEGDSPAGEITTDGEVLGTIDYMAPEQAVDMRPVDGRADIYSLGCTLYFLLASRPPYARRNAVAKLLAHREDSIPKLRDVDASVPGLLADIFSRMIAKKPEDRFASMREVADALSQVELETQGAALSNRGGSRSSRSETEPSGVGLTERQDRRGTNDETAREASTHPLRWRTALLVAAGGCAIVASLWVLRSERETHPQVGNGIASQSADGESNSTAAWAMSLGAEVLVDRGDGPPQPIKVPHEAAHESIVGLTFPADEPSANASLGRLNELPELRSLAFRGSRVAGRQLDEIGTLPGLRTIELLGIPWGAEAESLLKRLPGLHELTVRNSNAPLPPATAREIAISHPQLRVLSLRVSNVDADFLSALGELRKLNDLSIQIAAGIGESHLKDFGTLQNLDWLTIETSPALDDRMFQLLRSELPYCSIATGERKADALVMAIDERPIAEWALGRNAKLEVFVGPEYYDLEGTPQLPPGAPVRVQAIEFAFDESVGAAELQRLVGLRSLRTLGCYQTTLRDNAGSHLAALKTLENVSLAKTAISNAILNEVATMPRLSHLRIGESEISDVGLQALVELRALRTLDVRSTRVTPSGVREFRRARPECKVECDFSEEQLRQPGAASG